MAEARHVDADDPHAVDALRQKLQRHPAGSGNAQVGDHNRVVERGIGHLVTASRMSSKSLPVTKVSELNGT
jgi:hypothetical protein